MSDPWFRWFRRFGRLQLRLIIYRHQSHLPDRWVFQPALIYDRKRR